MSVLSAASSRPPSDAAPGDCATQGRARAEHGQTAASMALDRHRGCLLRCASPRVTPRATPPSADSATESAPRARRRLQPAKRRRLSAMPVHTSITADNEATPATVCPTTPKASPVWMKRFQPMALRPAGTASYPSTFSVAAVARSSVNCVRVSGRLRSRRGVDAEGPRGLRRAWQPAGSRSASQPPGLRRATRPRRGRRATAAASFAARSTRTFTRGPAPGTPRLADRRAATTRRQRADPPRARHRGHARAPPPAFATAAAVSGAARGHPLQHLVGPRVGDHDAAPDDEHERNRRPEAEDVVPVEVAGLAPGLADEPRDRTQPAHGEATRPPQDEPAQHDEQEGEVRRTGDGLARAPLLAARREPAMPVGDGAEERTGLRGPAPRTRPCRGRRRLCPHDRTRTPPAPRSSARSITDEGQVPRASCTRCVSASTPSRASPGRRRRHAVPVGPADDLALVREQHARHRHDQDDEAGDDAGNRWSQKKTLRITNQTSSKTMSTGTLVAACTAAEACGEATPCRAGRDFSPAG